MRSASSTATSSGRARLTDFGIAHGADDPRLTRSGVIGTQAYLAPELFEGAPITPAADLWSLGATLCCATTGTGPFDRDSTAATLRAILFDNLPLPCCPPPLSTAITALLTRDPARRATSHQVGPLLRQAAAGPTSDPAITATTLAAATPPTTSPGPESSGTFSGRWQQPTTHTPASTPPRRSRTLAKYPLLDQARAVEVLEHATQAAAKDPASIVGVVMIVARCLSHIDPARAERIARESGTAVFGPRVTETSRALLLAAATDGLVTTDSIRYARGAWPTRFMASPRTASRGWSGWPTGWLAVIPVRAVAILDVAERKLPSARRRLVHDRHLADITGRLALVDVARAEQVARSVSNPFQRVRATASLSAALIMRDPVQARSYFGQGEQVARSLAVPFDRMRALARVARELGALDLPRARTLISEAQMLLGDIKPEHHQALAFHYLAACGAGVVVDNEVNLGEWFTS